MNQCDKNTAGKKVVPFDELMKLNDVMYALRSPLKNS